MELRFNPFESCGPMFCQLGLSGTLSQWFVPLFEKNWYPVTFRNWGKKILLFKNVRNWIHYFHVGKFFCKEFQWWFLIVGTLSREEKKISIRLNKKETKFKQFCTIAVKQSFIFKPKSSTWSWNGFWYHGKDLSYLKVYRIWKKVI